jgi:hypothetical protein
MTAKALEIPPKPYTGEKARLSRAYDYLILVLALFLIVGAFHLHVALTVGDWDFSVDWKDRQWWPLVTPLIMIICLAAVQAVLWSNFRLPMGATLCISCLLMLDRANLRLSPVELLSDQRGPTGDHAAERFGSGRHLDVEQQLDHHQHLRRNCVRVAVLSEQLADFGMFHVPVEYGAVQLTPTRRANYVSLFQNCLH